MEEIKESKNDKGGGGSKRIVIKLGSGGGGGGIGAVVLLGGALVTAAFASAFVLGQRRRSSPDDRRHNSPPQITEKREKEDDQIAFVNFEGAREEIEKDSTIMIPAHLLKVDDKAKVETGLGKPGDAEGDKIQLTREDVSDGSTNLEQAYVEDESAVRESDGDGEIGAAEEEVNVEVRHDQEDVEGFCNGNGEIREKECVEPEVIESGGEVDLSDEGEMVRVNEVECIEEKTVTSCVAHLSPENEDECFDKEVGEELIEKGALEEDEGDAEQELIDQENSEATMSSTVMYGEVEKSKKNNLVHISATMDNVVMDYGLDRIKDLSKNEISLERGESKPNWEALWQAEWTKAPQQVKLKSYEVGGKLQEDKGVEKNSTRRKMVLWVLSVVSSLSCSWLFDLSFVKLCLVVFVAVFLLETTGTRC